jgi:hypothetical protein
MTGGTVREKEKYCAYEMTLRWWWVIDLVVESSLPLSQKHSVRALVESWLFVPLAARLLHTRCSPCRRCSDECTVLRGCFVDYVPIIAAAPTFPPSQLVGLPRSQLVFYWKKRGSPMLYNDSWHFCVWLQPGEKQNRNISRPNFQGSLVNCFGDVH